MDTSLQALRLSDFATPAMGRAPALAAAKAHPHTISAEDVGHQLVTVGAVMIALQVLAVGTRLLARRVQRTLVYADDYLILAALAGGLALCSIAIAGVTVGNIGRHTEWIRTNDPDSLVAFGKLSVATQAIQTPVAITFAKLSILMFFRRIFPLPNIRHVLWFLGAWIVAHGVSTLLVAVLQCIPLRTVWDKSVPAKCIDLLAWSRWMCVPNILSDVALIALPLWVVWHLMRSRTERLSLSVLFILGGFNIICSAIRMAVLFSPATSEDLTYVSVSIHTWTILEATTLIVAACLPSIWPLVKMAYQHLAHKIKPPSEEAPQMRTRLGLPATSVIVASWAERRIDDDLEDLSLPPSVAGSVVNTPAMTARETF